jgi:hypothetical protein
MTVAYERLPEGTNMRVVDWQGDPLRTPRETIIRGDRTTVYEDIPASLSGSGEFAVATHGAGVYRVETTFHLSASVTGQTKTEQSDAAVVQIRFAQ